MLDAGGTIAGKMIGVQSQLEGLRQIYTDNNARVRSLNARVAELRKQLEKLGGTQANAVNGTSAPPSQTNDPSADKAGGGLPYPTIKSLPLLGAKYADYYRRAKNQETRFEILPQKYRLAKGQEAKKKAHVQGFVAGAAPPKKKHFPPVVTT